MRFLKKYEKFNEELVADTKTKPKVTPGVKPGTRPGRPSPIRRDKPSVDPKPKANLPKSSEEEVANRFIGLVEDEGDNIKKYIN